MAVQIQFRRGTATQWTAANPVLAQGEMGVETDTGNFKVGNGSSNWNTLMYGGLQGPTGPTGPKGAEVAFSASETGPTGGSDGDLWLVYS